LVSFVTIISNTYNICCLYAIFYLIIYWFIAVFSLFFICFINAFRCFFSILLMLFAVFSLFHYCFSLFFLCLLAFQKNLYGCFSKMNTNYLQNESIIAIYKFVQLFMNI